jgi:2-phospho-L-lactate guanylyltransferase (CobY/MobA/RfbA family)
MKDARPALFRFGEGSAQRHAEAARSSGLQISFREDPVLSFDLDTPDDLRIWLRDKPACTERAPG